MSQPVGAKHAVGSTLARCPGVYPYLMEHIGETEHQKKLRSKVENESRSIMMGSPDEAQFLAWLLGLVGAKRVIEVGVFRGTTCLAMAQALPADGKVVGLDINEEYTRFGIEAWKEAGVFDKIDLRIAPAVESMQKMIADGEEGMYDLCFVDADKANYDTYYESALKLLRVGGIIAVDNTLWNGKINDPNASDTDTQVLRDLNTKIKQDPRVHAVMMGIADGVYMCRKL